MPIVRGLDQESENIDRECQRAWLNLNTCIKKWRINQGIWRKGAQDWWIEDVDKETYRDHQVKHRNERWIQTKD